MFRSRATSTTEAAMPQPNHSSIPPLVRFLMRNAALGAGAGIFVAGGLIATDAASIGTLFATTSTPIAAAALFFGMFALTFASLAMGTAIMTLGKDDEDDQ